MSRFSADWLALREPLDAQSRAAQLATSLRAVVAGTVRGHSRLEVVDLGSGTGANLRYAAPLLGGAQDWLLVESDPLLLAATQGRMQDWSRSSDIHCGVSGQQFDVRGVHFDCSVRSLALDLASQLDDLPLQRGALLTASALLDLVSESWLRLLLGRAAAAAAAVWFALTYDGRIDCQPAEAADPEVRELVNLHQLRDKGFGAALGPAAANRAATLLGELGYEVQVARSDWCIRSGQPALQYALVDGWFTAACESAPTRTAVLHVWRARRYAHIAGGRSTLRVGHVDMVGHLASASRR